MEGLDYDPAGLFCTSCLRFWRTFLSSVTRHSIHVREDTAQHTHPSGAEMQIAQYQQAPNSCWENSWMVQELNTSNSGVAFLVTQQYIICLQRQETQVWTWVGKMPWTGMAILSSLACFPLATRADKAWASSMCQTLFRAPHMSTPPTLTTSLKCHTHYVKSQPCLLRLLWLRQSLSFSWVWWPWSFWELLRETVESLSLWVEFLEEDHRGEWRSPCSRVYVSLQISLISSPHHLARYNSQVSLCELLHLAIPHSPSQPLEGSHHVRPILKGDLLWTLVCRGLSRWDFQVSWETPDELADWMESHCVYHHYSLACREMILLKNDLKTLCTCKTLDWSSTDCMLGHAFSAPGPIIFWLSCSAIEIPSLEKWAGFCPLQIAENDM